MGDYFADLAAFARSGESVATAAVIAARGSTPRGVGAKMIVTATGSTLGSVGGGCGEAQVFWEAARVLGDGAPRLCEVDLTGELNDESQTNCGGVMEIFVDCVNWEQPAQIGLSDKDLIDLVGAAAVERRVIAVMTIVACKREASAIALGAKWTGEPDGSLHGTLPDELRGVLRALAIQAAAMSKPRCVRLQRTALGWEPSPGDTGELAIFVEPLVPRSQLIIVGAGHIAQELARVGAPLEFEVVIVDDRAAYANRSRFPQADAIFVGPIEKVLKERPLGPETYIALVTRGHQQDEAALKVVIASEVAYIGMIGSRRRIKEIFRHLTEAGFDSNLFSKVHAPIGLKIEAETPAEIAVAIAAELVQVRRAGIRARTAAVADVL